jgi:hypothetical protein
MTVAVTIVMNEAAKIFCALFHDKEDGRTFGNLISTEILHAFIDEYQADLGSAGHNLKDFHGFHKKVADVIRNAARPIIAQCGCGSMHGCCVHHQVILCASHERLST